MHNAEPIGWEPCPIAAAYVADELAEKREAARWDIEHDRHIHVLTSIDALTSAVRGQRR